MKQCILKKGKEKALQNRHPWVFSGAIDQIDDGIVPGGIVQVLSSKNEFLATGYFNPHSQISIRILSFLDEVIDHKFFEKRITDALQLRSNWFKSDTDSCRIIHSEGDFLPGLIVDRYGDFLTVQFLTAGMDQFRDVIVKILSDKLKPKGIFERADAREREFEKLGSESKMIFGEEPPETIEISENSFKFLVNLREGQKGGFFLDQRENRKLIQSISEGRKVLNCFSYSGAFSIYASAGGASAVTSVDSSQPALNLAAEHFKLNKLSTPHKIVKQDVFEYLREDKSEFDLIILDPPAFCKSKHQIDQAARGYKDINLSAIKRITRGGFLFTASCSSFISPDLFQKIIFGAAKDTSRDLRIIQKTSHAIDHPISIYHPEGEYLKGLLCQIL